MLALIQSCVDADPSTLRHLNGYFWNLFIADFKFCCVRCFNYLFRCIKKLFYFSILEIIHVFIETLEECQTFKG